MKDNAAKKNNFFDPASLALDDDELELDGTAALAPQPAVKQPPPISIAPPEEKEPVIDISSFGDITPAAVVAEEEPHRFQDQFQDPLAELTSLPRDMQLGPDEHTDIVTPAWGSAAHNPTDYAHRAKMGEELFSLVHTYLPFDELTKRATAAILHAVDAETASLLEIDHQAQEFFFRAICDEANLNLQSVRMPISQGFAGEVLRSRIAEIVHDPAGDSRFQRAVGMIAGSPLHNAMAAPVLVGGEAFGVIEVFNKNGGSAFSNFDLATLQSGAIMLGKILEVRFFAAMVNKR